MAITPELEDSRFLRFPKDWFNLPWQERNKKFNELINNELERAKEYLNDLSQINEDFHTKSEIKPNVQQTPENLLIEDSEVVKSIKKVHASDLIEELDRIIQKTESKQSENFKAKKVKKKTKNDKKRKGNEKEAKDADPRLVKTLEEHLKDFLGRGEILEQRSSKQMERPPARRGVRRAEAGARPPKSTVQMAPEQPQTLLAKRGNPLDTRSPLPVDTQHSATLLAAASQARMPPSTHAPSNRLAANMPPRVIPQRVRQSRPPPLSTRPPARLPPLPQRLVPMVTLTIDNPEEHARALLARRILEPPQGPCRTSVRYASPANQTSVPGAHPAISAARSATISSINHVPLHPVAPNVSERDSKTTARTTHHDLWGAATPIGHQTDTDSSTHSVRHASSDPATLSAGYADFDVVHSQNLHASSKISTCDAGSKIVAPGAHEHGFDRVDPWISYASEEMRPISAHHADFDVAAPRVYQSSSETITSSARHAAYKSPSIDAHQFDVAAPRNGSVWSETSAIGAPYSSSGTSVLASHQSDFDVSAPKTSPAFSETSAPTICHTSLSIPAVSARQSDFHVPIPNTRHTFSEVDTFSARHADLDIPPSITRHVSSKTTASSSCKAPPKIVASKTRQAPSEMTTSSVRHDPFSAVAPTALNAASETGVTRNTVPAASHRQQNASSAFAADAKTLSRFGYYQVMRSEKGASFPVLPPLRRKQVAASNMTDPIRYEETSPGVTTTPTCAPQFRKTSDFD